MIQIISGGFVFWFLEFGSLQSGICIAAVTSGIASRLYSRVGEPQGGEQWKGLFGFCENIAKMIHPNCTVSSLDRLFLSRGHSAAGLWVILLPLNVVFSLCRTEDAAAQEMSPKRLVRTVRCDAPTYLQRPWQQGCRNRCDPERVIN